MLFMLLLKGFKSLIILLGGFLLPGSLVNEIINAPLPVWLAVFSIMTVLLSLSAFIIFIDSELHPTTPTKP